MPKKTAMEAMEVIKDFISQLASSEYGWKYRPIFLMLKRNVKVVEEWIEQGDREDEDNG